VDQRFEWEELRPEGRNCAAMTRVQSCGRLGRLEWGGGGRGGVGIRVSPFMYSFVGLGHQILWAAEDRRNF